MSLVSAEAREDYQRLRAVWPTPTPPMQPKAGAAAARALYRTVFGTRLPGKVIVRTGRINPRLTPAGDIVINPERGWQTNVHFLSHYFHSRLSRTRPHSPEHALLELRMARQVVNSRWLSAPDTAAAPRHRKPQIPLVQKRQQQIEASITRWERKLKRAQTALKKLQAKRRYYQRKHAAPPLHESATPDSLVA